MTILPILFRSILCKFLCLLCLRVKVHIFHVDIPLFQNHFFKRVSFHHWVTLESLSKVTCESICGLLFSIPLISLCQYHIVFIGENYCKYWSQIICLFQNYFGLSPLHLCNFWESASLFLKNLLFESID